MKKAKYNPINAFREDPLAGLKQATVERSPTMPLPGDTTRNATPSTGNDIARPDRESSGRLEMPTTSWPLSSAPIKLLSATLKPSRNTVYLYPEDLTKLRQLSGYASTEHGVRANDSMIVRAALSLVEMDVRFLHALKEAELFDRRRTARPS